MIASQRNRGYLVLQSIATTATMLRLSTIGLCRYVARKVMVTLLWGPLVVVWSFFNMSWLCFYQTRSAWSVDQGSNINQSPAYNFTPTVTKFCVMWEGLSLPRDTKFGSCRCKLVDSRAFTRWSLIHGLHWSVLIKVGPGIIQCWPI